MEGYRWWTGDKEMPHINDHAFDGTGYIENQAVDQADGAADIVQEMKLSPGTKISCTRCGREDWHKLLLRPRQGLYEALCLQVDGTGCFPNSPRINCRYVYPEGYACLQLAEFEVCNQELERVSVSCKDHVGKLLGTGPAYSVFPLVD